MSKLNLYETNWIDLVFENRNKAYGAYHLRQENTKTSLFALFVGILLLSAALSVPVIYNHLNPNLITPTLTPDLPPIVVVDLETYVPPQTKIEETIIPEIKKPITNSITNTQLTNPIIVQANSATPDVIATNTALKNTSSSTITGSTGAEIGTTTTNGTTASNTSEVPTNKILSSAMVDKMPEFPGGIKKFYSYVGTNFEKPEVETSNTMTIIVSFVVEKDGNMTDIKVLKDPGYGLGAEAIRVLKSLKTKWSPGMYEGKAVRTSYNLPITIQPN